MAEVTAGWERGEQAEGEWTELSDLEYRHSHLRHRQEVQTPGLHMAGVVCAV